MDNVFLFGASGHARVILDILRLSRQYQVSYLLDDNETLHHKVFSHIPVFGGRNLLGGEQLAGMLGLVSIGDNNNRQAVFKSVQSAGHGLINAIHPSAIIAESVRMGVGNVVVAGTVINPDTSIGDNTIINTAATIDHDCTVGSHVHIAPGCHVCGHVQIGNSVLIGAGSTIIPMINIGEGAVIGAGSTVTKNVKAGTTVVGSPARVINNT